MQLLLLAYLLTYLLTDTSTKLRVVNVNHSVPLQHQAVGLNWHYKNRQNAQKSQDNWSYGIQKWRHNSCRRSVPIIFNVVIVMFALVNFLSLFSDCVHSMSEINAYSVTKM